MQFKIDENLPIEIAELLINAGHDTKTINDQQLQGARDPLLINVCKSENRVLIALDTDFQTLEHIHLKIFRGLLF